MLVYENLPFGSDASSFCPPKRPLRHSQNLVGGSSRGLVLSCLRHAHLEPSFVLWRCPSSLRGGHGPSGGRHIIFTCRRSDISDFTFFLPKDHAWKVPHADDIFSNAVTVKIFPSMRCHVGLRKPAFREWCIVEWKLTLSTCEAEEKQLWRQNTTSTPRAPSHWTFNVSFLNRKMKGSSSQAQVVQCFLIYLSI